MLIAIQTLPWIPLNEIIGSNKYFSQAEEWKSTLGLKGQGKENTFYPASFQQDHQSHFPIISLFIFLFNQLSSVKRTQCCFYKSCPGIPGVVSCHVSRWERQAWVLFCMRFCGGPPEDGTRAWAKPKHAEILDPLSMPHLNFSCLFCGFALLHVFKINQLVDFWSCPPGIRVYTAHVVGNGTERSFACLFLYSLYSMLTIGQR